MNTLLQREDHLAIAASAPSTTAFNGAQLSDGVIVALVWLGIVIHAAAGVTSWRRGSALPLLPLVNLATALCVVAYWAQRWYGYLTHGITWYGTDQLIPAAALGVCLLSALSLAGRYHGTTAHWIVFAIDATVFVAAAVFVATFRMNRLF